MSKAGGWLAFLAVFGTAAGIQAEAQGQARERWTAPFGGTWSAKFTIMSEYAYRGISLTERQPGVQASIGYDLPLVQDRLDLYLETWGGNVHFSPAASTELTASASLVFRGFDNRLNVWFSFSRYNYLESPPELAYNYNEFYLWAGYDFGVLQLAGAVSYSPRYFADGGAAWYKAGELAVPLGFVPFGRDLGLKAFASLGNQYIERYVTSGLPGDNYWDWEIGLRARLFELDLALSYVDTSLDVAGCGNSRNCEGRVIFKMSKTF
jgi:uncharacterized protein (TIGR02001 family)